MPNSYVRNHVHMVFATKDRAKLIPEALQPKLRAYLAGIAKNHGMRAVAIGGIEDPRTRAHQSGGDLGHRQGGAGVEGEFLAMGERTIPHAVCMARGLFRVQRQPITGAGRHPIYCQPEGTP